MAVTRPLVLPGLEHRATGLTIAATMSHSRALSPTYRQGASLAQPVAWPLRSRPPGYTQQPAAPPKLRHSPAPRTGEAVTLCKSREALSRLPTYKPPRQGELKSFA